VDIELAQAVITASAAAILAMVKSRALSPMLCVCALAIPRRVRSHSARKFSGGGVEQSEGSLCRRPSVELKLPRLLTSSYSSVYWPLVNDGGGGEASSSSVSLRVNRVTAPNQGDAIGKKAGGVGRHSPRSVPPVKISGFEGKLPSLARNLRRLLDRGRSDNW
jgi:hypothetical protein